MFLVNGAGKLVAIPHGPLERACASAAIALSDELCRRIAGHHLAEVLVTGEDAEKDLLTLTSSRVEELVGRELERPRSG